MIFFFILATLCQFHLMAGLSLNGCLPAEDGHPYVLMCKSNPSTLKIQWKVTWNNGTVRYIDSPCRQSNTTAPTSSSCNTTTLVGRLSVSPVDQSGRSVLRIAHVTVWDHDAEIECGDVTGDEGEETVSTCQLQVYHKPESLSCQINKTGDNIVQVQCSTAKVFPGLVCSFAQFETTLKRVVSVPSELSVLSTEGTDNGYFRSTCTLTVYSLKPGTYEYFPVLQPNVTKNIRNTSVPVNPMKPVQINISPRQIAIYRDHLHPLSNECRPGIPKVVFICEALGFPRQPTFELLVDRVPASPMTSVVMETAEGRAYRTIFQLSESTDYLSRNVVCLAKYQVETLSRETRFDEMEDAGRSEQLSFGTDVAHTLTCHGRNLSDSSKLQITCFKDKHVLFTSHVKGGAAAELTLHVGSEAATCVCLTEDEAKCFSHETRFRFEDDKRKSDQHIFVYITLAVLTTGVAAVLVILLLVYWRLCQGKKRLDYSPVSTISSEVLENGGWAMPEKSDKNII